MALINRRFLKAGLLAAVAAGSVAATAAPAFADVACNRWGECWHVPNRFAPPPGARIRFYPDTWRAAHMHGRWHWLADHEGRGYYDHGAWRPY